MEERILAFISELNPYEEVGVDTQLLDDGILDSLTLVVLIEELEGEYGINIPEEMLQPERFETVRKIAELISYIQICGENM